MVGYGGARGGGKTDGVLGKYAIKAQRYGKHFNGVFFRQEMPQQDDLIERAKEIYLPVGANWGEAKKTFTFRAGGRVRFRALETVEEAEKYQGQNLTDAAVEESGNYEDAAPIDRLFGCLRSPHGVPVQLILTANPGGRGHHWWKQRFVDPAPLGNKTLIGKLPNGKTYKYIYIPSRVENNPLLLLKDPGYVDRLYLCGSEQLVRAWLLGDWTVIEGAFFTEFGQQHIWAPFTVPASWGLFRAYDHGSAAPFSVGWWAVADGTEVTLADGRRKHFPPNFLMRFREWYGCRENKTNTGLKLSIKEIADGIKARSGEEIYQYGVADTSIFDEDGGPSIAEEFRNNGVTWRRADKRRVPGWQQWRNRLRGGDFGPMVGMFSTCTAMIRCLPALQHDKHNAEDVDTNSEDHAPDEGRYGLMSRPYNITSEVVKPFDGHPPPPTAQQLLDQHFSSVNQHQRI